MTAVKTEAVEYRDGDVVLEGYLAYDDATAGRRPGVLIVHEWWGLSEHPRNVAERLAGLGYAAFALDMYGKGKVTTNSQEAGAWAGQFRRDVGLAERRFRAGLAAMQAAPVVDGSRIVAIGYCFGGGMCLEMARLGVDVLGVVSFHGGLASNLPPAERKLTAKILVCHGADDPAVPPKDINAFIEEMRRAGADWQMNIYGNAVHSFTNPAANSERARYNEKADRRSWQALKSFLSECFAESE
ncbi:dienelactone hydrolase family protein [bacterium]|nr:dienelactone hydrolase family protein [bacterium]